MAACILWWSICTILTGFAQGFWSLGIIRFLLGIGEPGNYPAALRATTRVPGVILATGLKWSIS